MMQQEMLCLLHKQSRLGRMMTSKELIYHNWDE